jgi:hypothetical protein
MALAKQDSAPDNIHEIRGAGVDRGALIGRN